MDKLSLILKTKRAGNLRANAPGSPAQIYIQNSSAFFEFPDPNRANQKMRCQYTFLNSEDPVQSLRKRKVHLWSPKSLCQHLYVNFRIIHLQKPWNIKEKHYRC